LLVQVRRGDFPIARLSDDSCGADVLERVRIEPLVIADGPAVGHQHGRHACAGQFRQCQGSRASDGQAGALIMLDEIVEKRSYAGLNPQRSVSQPHLVGVAAAGLMDDPPARELVRPPLDAR